ncbi:hypothetical protein VTK56DRAFT_5563 [Thermocarpiscus australiensis]
MSADFWAGYVSGAVGIIIGNPLDVLKVRLQAASSRPSPSPSAPSSPSPLPSPSLSSTTTTTTAAAHSTSYTRPPPFLLGTAAPVLGYGALNALLFVSYNRAEAALLLLNNNGGTSSSNLGPGPGAPGSSSSTKPTPLAATWLAGAVGGLATWVVSTPTELVKCRAQVGTGMGMGSGSGRGGRIGSSSSSWAIAKSVLRTEGVRGLYSGGAVTAIRDSVGYGFYFWAYELSSRWMVAAGAAGENGDGNGRGAGVIGTEAARVLLCGGLAGIVTWASIFPLDVIKTRVQTQQVLEGVWEGGRGERASSLIAAGAAGAEGKGEGQRRSRRRRLGAWEVAKETYREAGIRPFFRGLTVCSVRAFIVNAVQWAVYEWIMMELGQGRGRQQAAEMVLSSG